MLAESSVSPKKILKRASITGLKRIPGVNLSMVAARDANNMLADAEEEYNYEKPTEYSENLRRLADDIGYYRETAKLPDFDPVYKRYMGPVYKIPEDMDELQKVHTKLTGKPWKASAPKWLDWLIGSRQDRLLRSLAKGIYERKVNTKGATPGEIASLIYPNYVLREDGTIGKARDYTLDVHPHG